MAEPLANLTDAELEAVADDLRKDPSLLNRVDSDTRRRWVRVKAQTATGPIPASEQPPLPHEPGALGFLKDVANYGGQELLGAGKAAVAALNPMTYVRTAADLATNQGQETLAGLKETGRQLVNLPLFLAGREQMPEALGGGDVTVPEGQFVGGLLGSAPLTRAAGAALRAGAGPAGRALETIGNKSMPGSPFAAAYGAVQGNPKALLLAGAPIAAKVAGKGLQALDRYVNPETATAEVAGAEEAAAPAAARTVAATTPEAKAVQKFYELYPNAMPGATASPKMPAVVKPTGRPPRGRAPIVTPPAPEPTTITVPSTVPDLAGTNMAVSGEEAIMAQRWLRQGVSPDQIVRRILATRALQEGVPSMAAGPTGSQMANAVADRNAGVRLHQWEPVANEVLK